MTAFRSFAAVIRLINGLCVFVCEGLSLEECSLRVPDTRSSLLRELFETSDESGLLSSGQELSMYPKPQLSTVSVSYVSRELKAAPRLGAAGRYNIQTRVPHHVQLLSWGRA